MTRTFQLSVMGYDEDEDIEFIATSLAALIEHLGGPAQVPVKVFKSSLSKSRLFTAEFTA